MRVRGAVRPFSRKSHTDVAGLTEGRGAHSHEVALEETIHRGCPISSIANSRESDSTPLVRPMKRAPYPGRRRKTTKNKAAGRR
jgi:hypothetical protein